MKIFTALIALMTISVSSFAQNGVRWLEVPGQVRSEAELVVGGGVSEVTVNGNIYPVGEWGYVTVPVQVGQNIARAGTTEVSLYVQGEYAQTITVNTQTELRNAMRSLPNGGRIIVEGPGPYVFEPWNNLGNNDWIRIEGNGQLFTGSQTHPGVTRYGSSKLCFVNFEFDLPSIGQFYPSPGQSLAFIDCDFRGKRGDRWVRAANTSGEGQKFYFKRCNIYGITTHGFTDAQLVDRTYIEEIQGDAYQTSYAVTRSRVDLFSDSGSGHHKDLIQYFSDGSNLIFSDISVGPCDGVQTTFWEDNFHVGSVDPRTGQIRTHYEWNDVTIRRLHVESHNEFAPPLSQYWGKWNNLWIEDSVIPQGIVFRSSPSYSNTFEVTGTAYINGLIAGYTSYNESSGSRWGFNELPPAFDYQNVGIIYSPWHTPGFYDIDEGSQPGSGSPYTQAKIDLDITDPIGYDEPMPGSSNCDNRFDLTTTGAGVGDPGYLKADCVISGSDLTAYVNYWVAKDPAADFTTIGAGSAHSSYGVPDGIVTGADINFYVNYWISNQGEY